MLTCEYIIFEYAASDLQLHGETILIAVLLSSTTMHRVCAFIAAEWQELVATESQLVDKGYIEDFIYDLCQIDFFDREEASHIFAEFEGLSVGPLRTGHSGSYSYSELPPATRNIVEVSNGVISCDSLTFSALLSDLIPNRAQELRPIWCV